MLLPYVLHDNFFFKKRLYFILIDLISNQINLLVTPENLRMLEYFKVGYLTLRFAASG